MKIFILLIISTLVLASCGKKENIADYDDDSSELIAESALSSTNSALNDSEQLNNYAVFNLKTVFISKAQASNCDQSRFTPTIGSSNCSGTLDNKTVTANFDGCYAGPSNKFLLDGTITLSFDSSTTCDSWINGGSLPTSGYVVRTTEDFTRVNPNNSSVRTTSSSHLNYLNEVISGGVKTTFASGQRQIDILGLQKMRTRANGKSGFDHSIRTTQALVVSGTKALGTRTISSGIIQVDHNRAKYSMLAQYNNVKWSASCCHPVDGTITMTHTSSGEGFELNFATGVCGQVYKTDADGGTTTIELNSCE